MLRETVWGFMFKKIRQLPKPFPFKSFSLLHKFREPVWCSLITHKSGYINCFEMFVQFHPKIWPCVCVLIAVSRTLGNSHVHCVGALGEMGWHKHSFSWFITVRINPKSSEGTTHNHPLKPRKWFQIHTDAIGIRNLMIFRSGIIFSPLFVGEDRHFASISVVCNVFHLLTFLLKSSISSTLSWI